jgi:splicing factor 1
MARDCTVNKDPNAPPPPPPSQGGMNPRGFDSEYANLMMELGESAPSASDLSKPSWAAPPSAGHDITGGGTNVPPWRRPEAWIQPQQNNQQFQQGYRPPMGGDYQQQWTQYQQQGGGYNQSANYAAYYQGQYAQQQGN